MTPHHATAQIVAPRVPVFSNVTAAPFPDAASIRAMLARQLCEPVEWEASLGGLRDSGMTRFVECGPGQQIKAMVKRVDNALWKNTLNVKP